MADILIRGMCKLESGKSYRALFKELNGKFVVVVELVESYADREVEIYPVEELPPHGDLIDRDALGEFPFNMSFCDGYEADEWVQNAPAIVPASKSKEETA